jgi:hypothetical protein
MLVIVRLVMVLVGGLTVIALWFQNQTPLLTVTVLGIQFPPLSLGTLILLTCGLGVLTGTGFNLLLNRLQAPTKPRRSSPRRGFTSAFSFQKTAKAARKKAPWFRAPSKQTARASTRRVVQDHLSDWYTPPQTDWIPVSATEYDSRSPDEDFSDDDAPRRSRRSVSDFFQRSPEDDDAQIWEEDRSSRAQRVVDAEYRVIRPPQSGATPPPRRSGDEWDDEFFDED